MTLAQLGNWINPDIPPLPQPGLFQRFILENPAPTAVAILLIAAIVLFALRSRGRLSAGLITLAAGAVLAASVMAAGAAVRTQRETLLGLQDQLIDATAHARLVTLDTLLAPDARVPPTRLPQLKGGLRRDAILSTIESTLADRYRVDTVAVIKRQAVIDGPNAARSQVYIRVKPADYATTWAWFAITWRRDPDGRWRATEIDPLFLSGILPYQP